LATSAPLRLAVDGTPLLGQATGVGEVAFGLLDTLAGRPDIDVVAYALTFRGRRQLADRIPAGVRPAIRPIPARLVRNLWLRTDIPHVERWTGPVDVVHATFIGPPARSPVVVTIHDLTFIRFPELCTPDTLQYGRLVHRALDRGAVVHATSEFVAGEVRENFGIDDTRIVQIPLGVRPSGGGDPGRGRAIAGADRYVLALGTVEPRKNLPVLVGAFDAVAARDPALRLVVAGADGWGAEDFRAAWAAAKHADRVVRLGYVTDAQRRDLLAGARVLAYPSIYEGFGLSPLEAMGAGVPVVAACAGALPETLGDAAELVEPADVDGLADALDRVAHDDELRADLVARGCGRVEQYGWPQVVPRFVDLYRSLA
jgi:glycosyltransferase involved in cell wall biosynthesis